MPGRKRKQADVGSKSSDVSEKQKSKEPAEMTVAELRKELQTRDLDTSGRKVDLIPRLEEALKGTDGTEQGSSETPPSAKKAKTGRAIIDLWLYTPHVHYTHSASYSQLLSYQVLDT